ncbi:MAG: hypothetical protein HKM93_23645 [Desulfobacteraceae bacterium]|nr:hypothetical protein [Desulfobacteraceae bacterium]
MSPSDIEDQFEDESYPKLKIKHRRPLKSYDESVEDSDHKKKRSGKRFHRQTTLKDELWEDNIKPRSRK